MKIAPQSVKLVWITPAAQVEIELAARTCYKSEDKFDLEKSPDFLERVINQNHHESVMEHASASFRIVCDRGISHEIVRHRLASYSQESTRYCNYNKDKFGKEITVIEPPGLVGRSREAWVWAMEQSEKAYFEMLEAGRPPQIARAVLPTCLKTELVMTCNMREWKHFIRQRTSPAAHPQIQEIAKEIEGYLQSHLPVLFK